jgi:phospholipid/cholesterol/gamma-HCH transport system substrate-binding protein
VALGLGRWRLLGKEGYLLHADFVSASGLKVGAPIEVAGVRVGRVESIDLGPDYQARVALRIEDHVTIHRDAAASISREGIVGNQSVALDRGGSGPPLEPGDEIAMTESPTSFQDLIGKFVAGNLLPGN